MKPDRLPVATCAPKKFHALPGRSRPPHENSYFSDTFHGTGVTDGVGVPPADRHDGNRLPRPAAHAPWTAIHDLADVVLAEEVRQRERACRPARADGLGVDRGDGRNNGRRSIVALRPVDCRRQGADGEPADGGGRDEQPSRRNRWALREAEDEATTHGDHSFDVERGDEDLRPRG
ncbi:MAG: hypothetical protein U0470_13175 [Anaerolineae bacterium]